MKALLATEAEAIDLDRRSAEDILMDSERERGSNLESYESSYHLRLNC